MSVCRRQKKNVKGLLFRKATDYKRCVPAPPVRTATVPTPTRRKALTHRAAHPLAHADLSLSAVALFDFLARPTARQTTRSPPRISRLSDEVLKLRTFSFFAKHFKLCSQLTELK